MRLISKKNLLSAIEPYPDAQIAIESWYQLIKDNDWQSQEEVRNGYSRSIDEIYGYTIFNIKSNRYRLIVRINYKRRILYFKKFFTHADYSKINWNDRDEVEFINYV
jgi:mRNA interferase HigB